MTVSPPVLMASSARPSTVSRPDASNAPMSSVRNHPGSANGSCSGGLRYPRASVAPPITMRPGPESVSSIRISTPSSGTPSYTQPPEVSLEP